MEGINVAASLQDGTGMEYEEVVSGEVDVEVKEETSQSQAEDTDIEMEQSFQTTGNDEVDEDVKMEFSEEPNRTGDKDPLVDCYHEALMSLRDEDDVDADIDSQTERHKDLRLEPFETNDDGEKEIKIEFSEEPNRMTDDADPLDASNGETILPHHHQVLCNDIPFASEKKQNLLKRRKGPFKSKLYYASINNLMLARKKLKEGIKGMCAEQNLSPTSQTDSGTLTSERDCVSPPPPQRSSRRLKLREPKLLAETFRTSRAKPKVAVHRKTLVKQDELNLEIKPLKTVNPLQVLPNPENSMEHHCLICYKTLIDIKGGTPQKITCDDDGLHGNLNIFVILRSLLQVPSEDLKSCLRYCGNPTNWLRICMECQPLIQNALSVNDKLVEVLKELNNCRDLIVEQMKESIRRNNEAFENSGNCPTCGINGCSGHKKYLTEKIRKFVSKKTYPATINPYKVGDQEAEAKARIANVSISNSFLDSVGVGYPVKDIKCSRSDDDDNYDSASQVFTDDDTEDHIEVAPVPVAPAPHDGPPFLLILPSTDMHAPIQLADSSLSLHSSTFNVSTKTYHCSACPALPTPGGSDGMSLNQFLCHFTFHIRRPFQCSECKLFFPINETVRDRHWEMWHKNTIPVAGERFKMVIIRPVNLWRCIFCDKTFSTERDREAHLQTKHELYHKQMSKQYVCFHCPRMFYNKNDRRMHIVVDECSKANIFNCSICEKGFKRTTAAGTEYLDEPALFKHIDDTHPEQISSHKLKACELCGLVFVGVPNQFPGLVTHKRTTHGYATAFSCHICDEDFASGSLLNQHMSSTHAENILKPPLIVSKTVKKTRIKETFIPATQMQVKFPSVAMKPMASATVSFPSVSTMANESIKAQTESASKKPMEPLMYSCATCPHLSPKRLYDFLKHIAFHENRPNRCEGCSVYLPKDETVIADHWSQFHNGSDKFPQCTEVSVNLENIFKCSKCPERFSSTEEQFRHERRAHRSHVVYGEGKYTCVTCSQNLHSFVEWQLHRAVKHPQIAEMSCFYCEETFVLQTKEGIDLCDSIRRHDHVKNKHPNKQVKRADPCQLCGLDFESGKELNVHLRNFHSVPATKLHQCPIPLCKYAGKSNYNLRRHIELMHLPIPQVDYVCDNCGWTGKSRRQFHHHQFKLHGIVPCGITVLTCESEGCSFQAIRPYDIKKHALTHLPEKDRPFKCEVCGKGFYKIAHFMEHQEIHANKESKPHQCEICGNAFAVKNYLYIHKRLSHQRRFFPSTHKKKPKRTTAKGLSKKIKYGETTAGSSD
ncbi:unnamed protein product [Orchesella dallaii]|uniref:C2H2-type domain-containing protein n=1 Tax=Orchesella dallaii TaxID=48710 RepID=A0ABP1Q2S0_9HEXA